MSTDMTPQRLYVQSYANFRGVDFSNNPANVDEYHSPMCLNMISDENGYPVKRPGWRVLSNIADGSRINGIWFIRMQKLPGSDQREKTNWVDVLLVHCGTKIYRLTENDGTYTATAIQNGSSDLTVQDARSSGFCEDGIFYFLDGGKYRMLSMDQIDANGNATETITPKAVEDGSYIPTTTAGGHYEVQEDASYMWVDGAAYEEKNLLTDKRYNTFAGNGESTEFYLDSKDVNVQAVELWEAVVLGGTTDARPAVQSIVTTNTVIWNRNWYYFPDGTVRKSIGTLAPGGKVLLLQSEQIDGYGGGKYYKVQTTEGKTGYVLASCVQVTTMGAGSATGNHDWVKKQSGTHYTVSLDQERQRTKVVFKAAPAASAKGSGISNIRVTFTDATGSGNASRINRCTKFCKYGYFNDNRIFLSGDPSYQNTDYASEVDMPNYFPEFGYTNIGDSSSAIIGYVGVGDSMAVIKENGKTDAGVYMRSAEVQSDNSVLFPVKQGQLGIGGISSGGQARFKDAGLFLTADGVYEVRMEDISMQTAVNRRSAYVDTLIKKEPDLNEAQCAVWGDYFILCVNSHAYVADGRQYRNGQYEWFYWENIPARVLAEKDGLLYFGTGDGKLCVMNTDIEGGTRFQDNGAAIPARWATRLDYLGDSTRYKSIHRGGFEVMAKAYDQSSMRVMLRADRSVYTALNETIDTDDATGFYEFTLGAEPRAVKVPAQPKRFRSLQIIFENKELNEGFGLNGARLTYSYGRYVR